MTKTEDYRVSDQLLTVQQIADQIGSNPETVRNWIRAGSLEAIFMGGSVGYRIERTEFERFKLARKGAAGLELARRSGHGGFAPERGRNGERRDG